MILSGVSPALGTDFRGSRTVLFFGGIGGADLGGGDVITGAV